jgi:hypothetical protein
MKQAFKIAIKNEEKLIKQRPTYLKGAHSQKEATHAKMEIALGSWRVAYPGWASARAR